MHHMPILTFKEPVSETFSRYLYFFVVSQKRQTGTVNVTVFVNGIFDLLC